MRIPFVNKAKKATYPLSPAGRRYDWRADRPDFRDMLMRVQPPRREPLPKRVDLRSKMPPIVNQGTIGSCTGNALSACLEYLQMKQLAEPGQGAQEYDPTTFSPVSRLFIYYNERVLLGKPEEDSGAYLRDGIKSLNRIGACRESVWKYHEKNLYRRPAQEAYAEANQFKIEKYMRCMNANDVKRSLADGYPVAFGFTVYSSFEDTIVNATGRMSMPKPDEEDQGGHAVAAVGYDEDEGHFIIRNSWGESWGDHGYFYMPSPYLTHRGLASDFWSIQG